jgi:hypothetical protein
MQEGVIPKHVILFVPPVEGEKGSGRALSVPYDVLLVRAVDEFDCGMGTHGMPVSLLQLLTDSCVALPSKPPQEPASASPLYQLPAETLVVKESSAHKVRQRAVLILGRIVLWSQSPRSNLTGRRLSLSSPTNSTQASSNGFCPYAATVLESLEKQPSAASVGAAAAPSNAPPLLLLGLKGDEPVFPGCTGELTPYEGTNPTGITRLLLGKSSEAARGVMGHFAMAPDAASEAVKAAVCGNTYQGFIAIFQSAVAAAGHEASPSSARRKDSDDDGRRGQSTGVEPSAGQAAPSPTASPSAGAAASASAGGGGDGHKKRVRSESRDRSRSNSRHGKRGRRSRSDSRSRRRRGRSRSESRDRSPSGMAAAAAPTADADAAAAAAAAERDAFLYTMSEREAFLVGQGLALGYALGRAGTSDDGIPAVAIGDVLNDSHPLVREARRLKEERRQQHAPAVAALMPMPMAAPGAQAGMNPMLLQQQMLQQMQQQMQMQLQMLQQQIGQQPAPMWQQPMLFGQQQTPIGQPQQQQQPQGQQQQQPQGQQQQQQQQQPSAHQDFFNSINK